MYNKKQNIFNCQGWIAAPPLKEGLHSEVGRDTGRGQRTFSMELGGNASICVTSREIVFAVGCATEVPKGKSFHSHHRPKNTS